MSMLFVSLLLNYIRRAYFKSCVVFVVFVSGTLSVLTWPC